MRNNGVVSVAAVFFFGLFGCGESDDDKPVVNLTTLDCPTDTTVAARDDYMTICDRRVEVPVWVPKELPPPPPQIITTTVTVTADPLLVVTPTSQSQELVLVGQQVLLANMRVSAKNNNSLIRGLRGIRVPFGNDLLQQEVQLHVCPGGGLCFLWSNGVWEAADHSYRFPFESIILMPTDSVHYFTVVSKAKATGHLRVEADLTQVFDVVDLERKKVKVESDNYSNWGWKFLSALEVRAVDGEHLSDQPVQGAADQKIAEWATINHSKTATITQWGIGVSVFSSPAWPCLQPSGCGWKLKDQRGVVLKEDVIRSGELFRFAQMIFPPPALIPTSSTAVFALFVDTRDAPASDAPAGLILFTEVYQVYWGERPGSAYQEFPWVLHRAVGRKVYRR